MRFLYFFLLFTSSFYSGIFAQSCLPQGIILTKQTEVDSFPINYPGCTVIEGNVDVKDDDITNLNGLSSITEIQGNLMINYSNSLSDITGLHSLTRVGGAFYIYSCDQITALNGLENLKYVGKELNIGLCPSLTNLKGLINITETGGLEISGNPLISTLEGLDNIQTVSGYLAISSNNSLTNLEHLHIYSLGGRMQILNNPVLSDLTALESLEGNIWGIMISGNLSLSNLQGLNRVKSLTYFLYINDNPSLSSLSGLDSLNIIGLTANGSHLSIYNNAALINLQGLNQLKRADLLIVDNNNALTSFSGLDSLQYLGEAVIKNNDSLTTLHGLENLNTIERIFQIHTNPLLSDCNIFEICNLLINQPENLYISNNAPGCSFNSELETMCNSTPVIVEVKMDGNENCIADIFDLPASGIRVELKGSTQHTMKETDEAGRVQIGFLETGDFSLYLPEFPFYGWEVCEDSIQLNPSGADTLKATFVLSPVGDCPGVLVDLGMPSFFRGCLVNSTLNCTVRNIGTIPAEGVVAGIVIPPVFEVLSSDPPVFQQAGDTLYFQAGDIAPLMKKVVKLSVRTKCDTFLLGQTLCVEAFTAYNNPCSTLPWGISEIRLSSECVGDTLIRFTIHNVGLAPTMTPHVYTIFRNEAVWATAPFSLSGGSMQVVDVPADGATYRMEATRFGNDELVTNIHENCGGLTPGWVNVAGLEQHGFDYAFGCRQVIGSYDPNLKSAIPTGFDQEGYIKANQPLHYTIDFQNTGSDTAFRVLLRDILPYQLDIPTFRPIDSSHPYTWTLEGNKLEVLFSPIALPDSSTNEPASHGYFSFDIQQIADLPKGTQIENTASIIFDFNPPIITNTVLHTINDFMTVYVSDPVLQQWQWTVAGNPTKETAIFRTEWPVTEDVQFELFDVAGRLLQSTRFNSQFYEFSRFDLPDGLFIFRMSDRSGRYFTGRIILKH